MANTHSLSFSPPMCSIVATSSAYNRRRICKSHVLERRLNVSNLSIPLERIQHFAASPPSSGWWSGFKRLRVRSNEHIEPPSQPPLISNQSSLAACGR